MSNQTWTRKRVVPDLETPEVERSSATEVVGAGDEADLLFAAIPLPAWIYHRETLRAIAVNPAALRLHGYAEAEFLALSVLDLYPEEEFRRVGELLHGPAARLRGELRHRTQSGEFRSLEIKSQDLTFRGAPARLVIAQDLTARKQAVASIMGHASWFRTLVESSADVVMVLRRDGGIRYPSPAVEPVLGYAADALTGRSFLDLVHRDDLARFQAALAELCATPGASAGFELRVRHSDGLYRVLDLRARNLLADLSVRGLLVNARDVTAERARAEADDRAVLPTDRGQGSGIALPEAHAEAVSRAAGDLLAGVGHELRGPLEAVVGLTDLLRRNPSGRLSERELLYLRRIEAHGSHLLSMLTGVVDLAELADGQRDLDLRPVQMRDLVVDALRKLECRIHGHPVRLVAEVPAHVGYTEIDAHLLEQALLGVLGCALGTAGRNSVKVRVRAVPDTGRTTHIEVIQTPTAPVELADAPAASRPASDPSLETAGAQLELLVARTLCRILGVELDVQSRPHGGRTFTLRLPAAARAAA